MKILKLQNEPVFPLTIKRKAEARRPWVHYGKQVFKAFWPGGWGLYLTTECPTQEKGCLCIKAVQIKLGAEVWGSTGLCRFYFMFNDRAYEASALQGWKPVPFPDWYPSSNSDPSEAALNKMISVAGKMEVGK